MFQEIDVGREAQTKAGSDKELDSCMCSRLHAAFFATSRCLSANGTSIRRIVVDAILLRWGGAVLYAVRIITHARDLGHIPHSAPLGDGLDGFTSTGQDPVQSQGKVDHAALGEQPGADPESMSSPAMLTRDGCALVR